MGETPVSPTGPEPEIVDGLEGSCVELAINESGQILLMTWAEETTGSEYDPDGAILNEQQARELAGKLLEFAFLLEKRKGNDE